MKTRLFLAGLIAILLQGVPSVQAAPAEELFTKVKITLGSNNPPSPAASNSTPSVSSALRNKWLIISVEYTPVMPQKQRHHWIDDASMNIRAIFNGQSDTRAQPILFTGRSVFRTMSLDNRKHIATMMVPPQLLDRYLPSTGSASTVNVSNTFVIEATFRDRAGTVLGVAYYGQRSWSDKAYAEYFSKLDGGTVLTVPGAIYPRDRTPWAFHDIDNYDLLRPESGEVAAK